MDFGIFIIAGGLLVLTIGLTLISGWAIYRFGFKRSRYWIGTWAVSMSLFLFSAWIIRKIDLDETLWSEASNGNLPRVKQLVAEGADPGAVFESELTASQVASSNGYPEVAAYLKLKERR